MAELRSQIPDEMDERLEEVMEKTGLHSKKSEYIREAVRNQMRRDRELIEQLDKLDDK